MSAAPRAAIGQLNFRLRKAATGDAAAIARLIDRAEDLRQVSPRETFPLEAGTVAHWLRERDAGYVLLQGSEIVAYAELVRDAGRDDLYWVGHMMVQPHRRGLGLGRRTVVALMRVAVEQLGAGEVAISAFADNPRALHCYLGCGFRERSRQRVDGRELVEMRFSVPGHRRVVSRAALLVLVPAVVGVSAMLLPWGARSWLLDQSRSTVAILLLALAAMATGFAVSLQPILPRRRSLLSRRLGMPVVFGAVLGASVAAVAAVAALWIDASGVESRSTLFFEALASGLRHGAAWGVVLLMGCELVPRVLRQRRTAAP